LPFSILLDRSSTAVNVPHSQEPRLSHLLVASAGERDVVDSAAHAICRLHRAHGLEFACAVGQLVVDRFYGGDVDAMRQQRHGCPSLRRLAEHPALPMSASSLHRAIAIFDVVERVESSVRWSHLGPSHVRAVLPLPHERQEALLEAAEAGAWTVERLALAVREAREDLQGRTEARHRGGRPPLPRFVKTIRALSRLADPDEALYGDLDRAAHLAREERELLQAVLAKMKARCAELERALSTSANAPADPRQTAGSGS